MNIKVGQLHLGQSRANFLSYKRSVKLSCLGVGGGRGLG